jgi:predicted RNA methylase
LSKDKARCFGQDLMRGEHVVRSDSAGGKQGGRRRANAQVAGGGGGGWAEHNRKQAERAARRQALATPYGAIGADDDTSRRIGAVAARAIGTQEWVQGKIAEGDLEGGMSAGQTGTSIFDPVLCEIAYRWFCPPGGLVLDPFAGGSVRGIVAAMLGRRYVGIDLRPEQIAANREQAERICIDGVMPTWRVGDSAAVIPTLDVEADLVFSCPPYGDLEVYSDDPADLSTMGRAAFLTAYRAIVAASVARLAPNRFACFVVGDYRDKAGFYANFVGETVAAFEAAGARLYNEAILVTAAGSLPIRAGKQFASTRKLGKTHQNVLVFCKGDPRKATEACGAVEIDDSLFDGAEDESGPDEPSRID